MSETIRLTDTEALDRLAMMADRVEHQDEEINALHAQLLACIAREAGLRDIGQQLACSLAAYTTRKGRKSSAMDNWIAYKRTLPRDEAACRAALAGEDARP
jgi:hypothetical protein